MPTAALPPFEAQATACLAAAAQHRPHLLAVATKLTGCPEEGRDLFQQTCLNCHDAIQRRGFAGERYEFYLLTALKRLHYHQQRVHQRTQRTDFQASQLEEEEAPGAGGPATPLGEHLVSLPEGPAPNLSPLAAQVEAYARQEFQLADRVALRLLAEGYHSRQIAELMGRGDHSWVWRRLERVKAQLRAAFAPAWRALHDY